MSSSSDAGGAPEAAVTLDPALLELLRCPDCRGTLAPPTATAIACTSCGAAYPVRDGVPVLLVDEAERPPGRS